MDTQNIKRRYSIVMERTVRELNGESCIELDDSPEPKQQIMCSRSFGEKISDYSTLREAICEFSARAAEKLRQENQLAHVVNVFIRTSPFVKIDPNYSNSATGKLIQPSSDTRDILALTSKLFDSIWRDGYRYAKAGVMLGDFCPVGQLQGNLFHQQMSEPSRDKLMQAVDSINRHGQGKIWFGGQRPQQDWFMKQAHLSPAYTTCWDSLPLV